MKLKDYELLEEIGAGTFATVYKARDKQGQVFAIKKMKQMPRNDEGVVMNQIKLLKSIQHPNIIHFYQDFKENNKWYLVFQYCGKGDLQRYKIKQGQIPEAFTKNIFYNIVEAVCVLHQNNIVHRDLKLANVLINDQFEIKLADFGFSKDSESQLMTSFCGTPLTMAPEILQRKPYDKRCDTWSLGILLYQLIYGKPPFYPSKQYGVGIIGLTNAVLKASPIFDESVQVSNECKDIILKCLQKDVSKRVSAQQLKDHPWLLSGIKSHIRREYLKESMSDYTDAAEKAKFILSKSLTDNLKQLIQEMLLTEPTIRQNLKLICKYYPDNDALQMEYILKVSQCLKELSQKEFIIKIQGSQFRVPMNEIKRFKTHKENLKELLKEQLEKRKQLKSICLDKEIIKFISKEYSKCVASDQKILDKVKLLYELSKLCLNHIQFVQLNIKWAFPEDEEPLRKPFAIYLSKQTHQTIVQHINDQHHDKEHTYRNWLVEKVIQYDHQNILEHNICKIIKSVIQINNSQVIMIDKQ